MSTVKVTDIIRRVEDVLQDTNIRWPRTELQNWMNESYLAITLARPDANAKTGSFTCAAGTRQTLTKATSDGGFPSGLRLLDVTRNLATDSGYKVIRLVARSVLDDQRPAWHAETGTTSIQHFTFDPRQPKEFFVYPPATTAAEIEVVYTDSPGATALTEAQLDPAGSDTTVILLDDSISMNTKDGFSKAQAFVSGFLKNMNQQSETTIIQLGGIPSPVFEKPTTDPLALDLRVGNLDACGDRASILASLDQALSIISEGKNLKKEIILLSDFRQSDWIEWDGNAINSFRERLNSSSNPPELTWIDFGKEAKKNLSIEEIVLSSQTVGVGHPVRVRATLRNLSDEAFEGDLRVLLTTDQNESVIDEAAVSVGPQATTQVAFTHQFDQSGPKVLHIELIIADDLPQDNRRSVAISVIEQIDVLLIDGDPSKEWLRGESDFLKLALTPFIENTQKKNELEMKDLIQATTIPIGQLDNAKQLDGARLIILANVKELKPAITEELQYFVENGGGLLICAGNQINPSWYNDNFGANGLDFLPMPIIGIKGIHKMNSVTKKSVVLISSTPHSRCLTIPEMVTFLKE